MLTSNAVPAGKTVYFGIISDGIHTHPAALRIAYRSHAAGLILVTDAISTLGFTDGIHYIGQLAIEVRDGKSFIAGTETLCGNMASMDECIRRFRVATDCSIVYVLEAASLHPATCLNINGQKGTLNFSSDADFVLLDNELNVVSTWIAGECVYYAKDDRETKGNADSAMRFKC